MKNLINDFLTDQSSIVLAKKVVAHASKHPMTECVYAYEVRLAKTVIAKDAAYRADELSFGAV